MSLFDTLIKLSIPIAPKPLVGRIAKRYVAGDTLAEAISKVETLASEGAMSTLDVLGESIREPGQARATLDSYLLALEAIVREGLPTNLSIKPTAFGLELDLDLATELLGALAREAAKHDIFVRIDMEDHTTTDDTLELFRRLNSEYGNLGVVLQAYMRRTLSDIDDLLETGFDPLNVRLCKGIYIEPEHAAWKEFDTVRRCFTSALEKLFRKGFYVGIATHDEVLAAEASALIDRLEIGPERYEFQMLLGVRPLLREALIAAGHRLRVYVPYGRDWYLYSTRRLRENPGIARHVIKATLSRR